MKLKLNRRPRIFQPEELPICGANQKKFLQALCQEETNCTSDKSLKFRSLWGLD
jgi:hypothetical protein